MRIARGFGRLGTSGQSYGRRRRARTGRGRVRSRRLRIEELEARMLLAPLYQVHGLDFGPYIDSGENPNRGPGQITEQELRERLAAVADYTKWIRTFDCTGDLAPASTIIHDQLQKQAAVGAWIGRDEASNQAAIDALVAQAVQGDVDLAVVGSEALLRGELSSATLVGYINDVRTRLRGAGVTIPVTTADVYSVLLARPEVLNAVDVVFVNYYPFWEGSSVETAVYRLHRWHQELSVKARGKEVIVSETGWPSAGEALGEAVPSPENAAYYFQAFVSWARANEVDYFYFETFDEPWKISEGERGKHWGVWNSDQTLKPGMERVFNNEILDDCIWTCPIPGPPIVDFAAMPDTIATNLGTFLVAGATANPADVVKLNGQPLPAGAQDALGVFALAVPLQPGQNALTLTVESAAGVQLARSAKQVTYDPCLATGGQRLLYVDAVPGESGSVPALDGTVVIAPDQNVVLGLLPGRHVRGISPSGGEIYMQDRTVFSTSNHQLLRMLPFSQEIPLNGFLVSPLGDRLYSRNEVADVRWNMLETVRLPVDITTGYSYSGDAVPGGPAISADGATIYARDPVVRVDTRQRTATATGMDPDYYTSDLALTADESQLLSSGYGYSSGRLGIFDVATETLTRSLYGLGDFSGEIGLLADGTKAVVGSAGNPAWRGDGRVSLIDLATQTIVQQLPIPLADNLTTSGSNNEVFVSSGDSYDLSGKRLGVDVLLLGQAGELSLNKTFFLGINQFTSSTGRPRNDQIRRIVFKPAPVFSVNVAADTGRSAADGITNDQTLMLFGMAESGATVDVFQDGVEFGTAEADADGYWSWDGTDNVLAEGDYDFSFQITDAWGHMRPSPDPLHVTVETTPPTVTVEQSAVQLDPTDAPQIAFSVVFSEAVSGFAAEDVILGGTAPGELSASVAGSGTTYEVLVSGMTGSGTVTAEVPAAAASDTAGNPNAAGSSTDNSVAYVARAAQGFPYPGPDRYDRQGFESGSLDALPGWRFAATGSGTWTVTDGGGPHEGTHHLQASQTGSDATVQQAVLKLDLSSQAGGTGLVELDFWLQRLNSAAYSNLLDLSISGDEVHWSALPQGTALRPALGQYTHYGFDLRAALSAANITLDGDVYVMFQHSGAANGETVTVDDVRVSDVDVFGPRVTGITPVSVMPSGGPLSSVRVIFDEAVDPAGLNASEVRLKDPLGGAIGPLTIAPVPGSGNTQCDVSFAPQNLRGTYRLMVNSTVTDLAGNRMNQDGDPVNGEPEDAYQGTVTFEPTVWTPPAPVPVLYEETFEDWPPVPTYWAFETADDGTIEAGSSGGPHGGSQHLRFNAPSASYEYQSATVVIDISPWAAATNLSLEFWAKAATSSGYLYVDFSPDGTPNSWRNVASWGYPGLATSYTHFTLDLDSLAEGQSIARDADFFIRFRDYSYGPTHGVTIDDVRIVRTTTDGPVVVAQTPLAVASASGPLSSIRLTFDRAMNPGGWDADDVELKNPQGFTVPVTVAPVPDSGDTQFDVTFAPQDLRGTYRVAVGPNVADAAGHLMNQDGDLTLGEAEDAYRGTVAFEPAVWSPASMPPILYADGFEGWAPAPSYWAFETVGAGTIQAVGSNGPHAGLQHLLFHGPGVSYQYQSAVMAVDLSAYGADTDLTLSFWAKYANSSGTLFVDFSSDGTSRSWQNVAIPSALSSTYTSFTLDLDELAAAKSIARDGTFYIRFRDYTGYYANHDLYLDDVRVESGTGHLMVVAQDPTALASADGPLAAIRLTFYRAVDPATFDGPNDVVLKDPQGTAIGVTVDPVVGSGNTQFDLKYAAQDLRGTYRLSVGPNIADPFGTPLNQDGDVVNGEIGDAYQGTLVFASAVCSPAGTPPGLYAETFEVWPPPPACWAFETVDEGTLQAVTGGGPHGGSRHLMFNAPSAYARFQSATWSVDLSAYGTASDVNLSFWAKYAGGSGTLYVDLSPDGTPGSWQNAAAWSTSSGLTTSYANFTLDLDALAATYGIALDAEFYIRFRDGNTSWNHDLYLDDVRVVTGDLTGPAVTSHTPTALASSAGPLSWIRLTFDEALGFASFEADGRDVVLKDPQGSQIPVTVAPVAGSGDTQFDLSFVPQQMRGFYRLTIATSITDASGNLMNQDRDAVNGETHDVYTGTVEFAPTVCPAGSPPVLSAESFEGWLPAPTCWAFQTANEGTLQAVSSGSPHSGMRHLLFNAPSSSGPYQAAVMAVDLSEYRTVTNLSLDFWAKYANGSGMLYVDLSPDGTADSWQNVATFSTSNGLGTGYANFSLDLDGLAAQQGISRDDAFYVRFRDEHGTSTNHDLYLDDVRIILNRDPVAEDDAYQTDEDVTLFVSAAGVLVNDSDPDGQAMIVIGCDSTSLEGTVTCQADGSFTFQSLADHHGLTWFDYLIRDTAGATATARVVFDVLPVNDAPVLDPIGNKTVNEGMLLQFTVTAGDPNDVPANAVTLATGVLPTGATFDPVTGLFAWTPGEGQQGQYVVTFTATDDGTPNLTDSEAVTITVTPPLQVTQFAATVSGFVAQFNRDVDGTVLNLYDSASQTLGAADVTVTGATVGPVRGSLVVSADRRQITFIQTGGLLQPDTYTVTLYSGATRLRDTGGGTLDGNADGTTGDDYQTTFTVSSRLAGTVAISLPDFARGAGQSVNVPNTASGLPIRLDNAEGVTSLAVDLVYDGDLLEITAATLAAGLPADWTVVNPPDTSTPGVAKIRASGTTPLSGTNVDVVRLTAAVPAGAPYGVVQTIRLENVSLSGGTIEAVGDVAVHKAVYLGDADGSGIHSSADAFLIVQAALGLASGFAAHAWTDPRIVADADGSGVLSAADAFLIVQEGLGLSEPFVPDNPHITVTPVGGGVDPQFRIGDHLSVGADGVVSVPVLLAIEPEATNVGAVDFDLFFDPSRLTIDLRGGISAGVDTAGGWAISARLINAGHLRVGMISSRGRPLAPGLREVARVVFHMAARKSSRTGWQPVSDGLPTRPTLLPPITGLSDGSETHPTLLDIEPVDPRAGGYIWTAVDGNVAIVAASAWRNAAAPLDVRRDNSVLLLDELISDLLDEGLSLDGALSEIAADVAVAWR